MNSNNLQQWWENTYRHHQLKHAFNPQDMHGLQVPPLIAEDPRPDMLNQIGSNDNDAFFNYTITNSPNDITDLEDNPLSSVTLLIMVILFGLVVFGGVLGNATLLFTLCSASSVRLRNPLLLAVCLADFLVTGISAPMTLLNVALNRKTNTLPLIICKVIHYVQIMPVAASTISFFMLSLDRYATVKHPCLSQLRQRRYLHVSLAVFSWIASAVLSAPFLYTYNIIAKSSITNLDDSNQYATSAEILLGTNKNAKLEPSLLTTSAFPNVRISCTSELGSSTFLISFIICHTFAVFVIPGFGVLLNHYGVRQKLCALSLTARAAHGELPLPMPILRRQTHMVIVTGIANAQQAGGCPATNDTSNGPDIQMQNLNPGSNIGKSQNFIKSSNPISPRAMREVRAHSQRQRINHKTCLHGPAAPGIPLPRTSTLHSRRRLANVLIASAIIFILCWAPHVFCIFYTSFGYKHYCSKTSKYFHLLLGYTYSTISPLIYWILNHNSLRQSPCAPIIRLRSMQSFLRSRFRANTVPPPPSSTNEAALGAFNPKLIKLTPKQYRAQASSHYLY
ncbi:cholecystokinin receptor type A [Bactrocera oleae]|uniref:cholecystokinin receptor type A n=1 Tax=Bactrocera oleae TaxID=104688 RepID=UPI0006B7C290|nr:uncharacterized protein LOC106624282 isoform X1 [Bactrocera oleae]XP_036231922.1 uncharacterized protein LOC106624282 isoform X1 [Bactrocera oleae]